MPFWRIPIVSYRRAALFVTAIGVPLVAGFAAGEPAGALLGCVSGLLFSFSDEEGSLLRRYRILFMVAAAMAVGAVAGAYWRGFPWPVWVLFIGSTFAAGAFTGIGKASALAARHGAMALVVVSGAPELHITDIAYAVLALATAAVARTVDHALAGPLPHLRGGPPRGPEHDWLRFALAYAGVAAASLWIGIHMDPSRALWVTVTTLVVMMADARASYVRIVERVAGTAFGVIAAYGVTYFVQSQTLIAALAVIVAALVPHHLQHRYWLHTALIALLILLAYDLATYDPRILHALFTERVQDVLLGGALALIGTAIAFPRQAPDED
jgi:uncharacterized membrane protein YccC